ncbi:MAG: hypothetical protein ACXWP5_12770 [Bdellovibrionota bacterium]
MRTFLIEAGIVTMLLFLVCLKISSEIHKENTTEAPIHLSYD